MLRDRSQPLETVPGAEADDPVEAALALGVRALAEAIGRASPGDLPGLAERMGAVVAEITARRTARMARPPARVIRIENGRRGK